MSPAAAEFDAYPFTSVRERREFDFPGSTGVRTVDDATETAQGVAAPGEELASGGQGDGVRTSERGVDDFVIFMVFAFIVVVVVVVAVLRALLLLLRVLVFGVRFRIVTRDLARALIPQPRLLEQRSRPTPLIPVPLAACGKAHLKCRLTREEH